MWCALSVLNKSLLISTLLFLTATYLSIKCWSFPSFSLIFHSPTSAFVVLVHLFECVTLLLSIHVLHSLARLSYKGYKFVLLFLKYRINTATGMWGETGVPEKPMHTWGEFVESTKAMVPMGIIFCFFLVKVTRKGL